MQCERVLMVNFCGHRYKEVRFGPGMTAIIGANGSGKSNVLDAIRLLLTGTNPYAGVKQANISWLATADERSYVEGDFSHGASRFTVRRNLRPASPVAVMMLNGSELRGDAEVTKRIEQILGISSDIVNEVVIAAQEDILGFIGKPLAKRAEMFQRWFNTEKASQLYKALGDHARTITIPETGVTVDELNLRISSLKASLDRLEPQLAGLMTYELIQQSRDNWMQLINQATTFNRIEADRVAVQQRIATTQEMWNTATVELNKAKADRELIQLAAEGNQQAAADARAALTNLSQYRQSQQHRQTAEDTVVLRRQAVVDLESKQPVKPVDYVDDLAAAETTRDTVVAELSRWQTFQRSVRGDLAECPTCFTPTSSLRTKIDEAPSQVARLTVQLQDVNGKISLTKRYDTELSSYLQNLAVARQHVTTAEQYLASIPVVQAVAVDEAALNQVLMNEQTYREGLAEYDRVINDLTSRVAHCEGGLASLRVNETQLTNQLGGLSRIDEAQVQTARTEINVLDQTAYQRRQLEAQYAADAATLEQVEQSLAKTQEVLASASIRRDWLDHVQKMRDVLHKDAAPRFVAQRNLQRLQASTNLQLERFGANYRVEATEGLAFTAFFPDGRQQPDDRLSEGQQAILATAFRVALNLTRAENLGALYLDEPTAWVDEDHIRGFEPVLNSLREVSASRGLQVIIITHERSLAPMFDAVVQL